MTAPDQPTLGSAVVFHLKVAGLRVQRWISDLRRPVPRHARGSAPSSSLAVESRSKLWNPAASAERAYEIGKVQNLRAAAARLDGLLIPGGKVFSFWRQMGRATARRGFVRGRMLQQGCLVPSVGGGLCQLSNALYQVALEAGCEIVERHAHSRVVPGSGAALGQDATIAWNYVDLRFRPKSDLQLEVRLTPDELVVRMNTRASVRLLVLNGVSSHQDERAEANNCFTCGADTCLHHPRAAALPTSDRRAFLMDERWPEFERWIAESATAHDALFIPLNGARWGLERYRWSVEPFGQVRHAAWPTLRRSWASRRLAAQGAARQQALLAGAEALARAYGRALRPEMTSLVVAQSLLPFLWRDGHLGGREFTVVMTRLPISNLERTLDAAFARHPEYPTLIDFRAPAWLAAAESEALASARIIVTPHAAVADLFGGRATRLDWILPRVTVRPAAGAHSSAIGFPGPAVARRGAHLVRAAAKELGFRVVVTARSLEGDGFWDGICQPAESGSAWLGQVQAVVLPAIVENQPRALLAAIAAGVPVIASRACGIEVQPGLTLIDSEEDLVNALRACSAATTFR
ncbi:MAG: VanW family protein [Bryobacteraceae bacterium]